MESDKELRAEIVKYVNHCKMVGAHSKAPIYKTYSRALAMDKAIRLRDFAKANVSMQQVARMAISSKEALMSILPVPNNASYESSLRKLNNLLIQLYKLSAPVLTN